MVEIPLLEKLKQKWRISDVLLLFSKTSIILNHKNFPLKDSHLIKGGVLEHRLTNGELTAGCKQ